LSVHQKHGSLLTTPIRPTLNDRRWRLVLVDAAAVADDDDDDDAPGAIMNEPFCAQYPGAADRFTTLYASWTNRLDPLYYFYSISYSDSACPRAF